jgi:hypothetical protein
LHHGRAYSLGNDFQSLHRLLKIRRNSGGTARYWQGVALTDAPRRIQSHPVMGR